MQHTLEWWWLGRPSLTNSIATPPARDYDVTTTHRAAALALDEALAKVGVEKIAPAARGADRFDPALHEATYPVPVQAASGADGTSDSGGGSHSSGAAAVVAPGTIMELLQARARACSPHSTPAQWRTA